MTKLVDAVIGRPDDEAARRADRILAMAGLLGQIALAGFQSLAVRRAGRGARRPVRRHHGARRRRRARVVAWACGAAGRRPAAPVAGHARAGLRRALHRPRARGRRARRDARRPGARAGEPRPPRRRPLRRVGAPSASPRSAWSTRSPRSRPPDALLDGLDQPLAAAGALAAVAGALLALSRAPLRHHRTSRRYLLSRRRASRVLYLASVEVVTLAGAGAHGPDAAERAVGAGGRRRARPRPADRRPRAAPGRARPARRSRSARCSSTTWRRWTRCIASGR